MRIRRIKLPSLLSLVSERFLYHSEPRVDVDVDHPVFIPLSLSAKTFFLSFRDVKGEHISFQWQQKRLPFIFIIASPLPCINFHLTLINEFSNIIRTYFS